MSEHKKPRVRGTRRRYFMCGRCGIEATQGRNIPDGWHKVTLNERMGRGEGSLPIGGYMARAYLCPPCWPSWIVLPGVPELSRRLVTAIIGGAP